MPARELTVSELWIHPIKSCRGISVLHANVGERGFDDDRRYMIVDEAGRFITQREERRLALVEVTISDDVLSLSAPGLPTIAVPRAIARGERLAVVVWRSECEALVEPEGSRWLTLYLIAGMLWNGSDQEGFVARVDAAGAVQWAKRYGGCDAAPELVFTAGIVHSSGDALLVGRDGSPQRGFVMRLKPDGTLGYFTSLWTGTNLEDVALHSVAELPTGGLLVAGRYVPYTPNDNVLLAMLDAVGQPLWAKIFRPGPLGTLPAPDAHFASLRLTDDGGVMLAAISNQPQPGDGSIWAMKLPAKDGQMTFTGSPESADLVLQDNGCVTGELPWAVDVHDLPAPEPKIRSVTVTPAALDVASQGG